MLRTTTAEVTLTASGCVVARIDAGSKQSMTHARENLAATISVGGGVRRPLLIDIARAEPLEAEVRHFYSGEKLNQAFVALALVIGASPLSRMMGNVYLRVARPGIPTRLFGDETEALRWLGQAGR